MQFSCKKKKNEETQDNLIVITDTTHGFVEYILIEIEGIKNVQGKIRLGLYDNETALHAGDVNNAITSSTIEVSNTNVQIKLDSITPGTYAVNLFHDENDNSELDKNGIGIPKEGFGFSNNALGTFGPPSFDEAKFTLPENGYVEMQIALKFY